MAGNVEQIETVIIGGGHAGLTMSHFLSQAGREHVVLERGRVGERWRSERWDSFCFQFPNWTIELPGYKYECDDPDAFAPGREVVRFLDGYADFIKAPVRSGVSVRSLERADNSSRYLLKTNSGAIEVANVVIATGPFQFPAIPPVSAQLPGDLFQVHSSNYRNPTQLPSGAVLVVGSGSSGGQIADELIESGRRVYFSVGRHRRVPRRYRGRDYVWWSSAMGLFDQRADSLPSVEAKNWPLPLLTGVKGGYDLDLRRMAAGGATLLGHLRSVSGNTLGIADDLKDTLAKADVWFTDLKKLVDDYVTRIGMDVPNESPLAEGLAEPKEISNPLLELDLKAAGITSIVWATGFRNNFDWVKLPVFDATGDPVHQRGITNLAGIYFLGLRWLYKRKSFFLIMGGPAEDALYVAEHITGKSLG